MEWEKNFILFVGIFLNFRIEADCHVFDDEFRCIAFFQNFLDNDIIIVFFLDF